jgi:hypothetical protein
MKAVPPVCVLALLLVGCFKESPIVGTSETDAQGSDTHAETSPTSATSATDSTADTADETSTGGSTSDTAGETDTGGSTSDTGTDSTGEATIECDPFEERCPQGQKCQLFPDAPSVCVDAPRPLGGVGASCEIDGDGIDDCGPRALCWYVDPLHVGTCTPLCTLAPLSDCGGADLACALPWADAPAGICAPVCDPLLADCGSGAGCYPGVGDVFVCLPQGNSLDGAACEHVNDCAPLHLCVDASELLDCQDSSCCSRVCDTLDPDDDPCSPLECVSWFVGAELPPGYEGVGVCKAPN